MNIDLCLEKYSDDYFRFMFGDGSVSEEESFSRGKTFLEKYAIDDDTFRDECKPIMQQIFKLGEKQLFDVETMSTGELFQRDFCLMGYSSSHIFYKESFLLTQDISRSCNEKFFYIIEWEGCEEPPEAAFKLRIPVDISWKELISGGCVSTGLFQFMNNEYYVFGDSGKWGKWCSYGNAYTDYEVFGYKQETPQVLAYRDFYAITKEEFKGHQMIPDSLRVAFWNTVKQK